MIRPINENDLIKLRKIHQSYFKDEFEFPDFLKGFNCSFLIEQDDQIIVAGGIRPIAEVVLMTNKSLPAMTKIKALKDFLKTSKYIGEEFNYDSIHAFIQDPVWKGYLLRNGFEPTKGQSILYHL